MNVEWRGISITKIAGNPARLDALRLHLEEVIRGGVFRGSPRGQEFLRYVVERSIEGDFDSLKERMIGIQLFRRSPSYDTSEDAIVRVTASDVRKRLQQHYGRYGEVDFRIDLQPGSYIPEITYLLGEPPVVPPVVPVVLEPSPLPILEMAAAPVPALPAETVQAPVATHAGRSFRWTTALLWVAIPVAILSLAYAFWARTQGKRSSTDQVMASSLPWSTLIEPDRTLQIIPSDPDFATLQDLTGHAISLADYANGRYVPDSPALSPEMRAFSLKYLRGARAADVDLPIVADIVSLANAHGNKVAIRPARHMRLTDFDTDDDFVLLGSPIANPWVDLFDKQLDFRFHFADGSSSEWIENARPGPGELKTYSPVAGGFESKPEVWATFAIVTFLQNPHHRGHVLILAGVGAEGTGAAAHFATDRAQMSSALGKCAQPAKKMHDFELLLRVNVMAGSALSTDVIACHRIS